MDSRQHILFICSRLDEPGGTERANLNAAHLFLEKGYRVTILILDVTEASFYPIDIRISIIQRPFTFGISQNGNMLTKKMQLLNEIRKLRKLIRSIQAHTIIATDYPYAVALMLGKCNKWSRIYSWEHHHYHWIKKSSFWNYLIRLSYPKLDGIIVYNKDEPKYYSQFGCKIYVIPNFIAEFPAPDLNHQHNILTVGWLNWRKGIDLIPYIANRVLKKHSNWKWKIIGQGELKEKLLEQIKDLDLNGRLVIEDPVKPLLPEDYQKCGIYVMTSRMEPFGLVLIEAMSNNIPCIAFDCESGPRNIITHNEDGILIPLEDQENMVHAIDELISNENKRSIMGSKAYKNVERFSAENIFQLWKEIIG